MRLPEFGNPSDDAFISELIDVLGEWHDEEVCDGPADLIDEVGVVVAVVERLRQRCADALAVLNGVAPL